MPFSHTMDAYPVREQTPQSPEAHIYIVNNELTTNRNSLTVLMFYSEFVKNSKFNE